MLSTIIRRLRWLKSLRVQYAIGLLVNVVFILVLLNSGTAFRNLQMPEGEFSDNLWKRTDVISYWGIARNFTEYGVFGSGQTPSFNRTPGYPLFLASAMMLFGENWLIWIFFIQAFLFAFMYPAISKIAQLIFRESEAVVISSFIFFLLMGTYYTRVPVILTDLFFTTFFTLGLVFGLLAVTRKNWWYLCLQLIFTGYAALVRPTLIFYPLINLMVLTAAAKRGGLLQLKKVKRLIAVSSIALLVLCQGPSIRNYANYGIFRPTDLVAINLFDTAQKVLIDADREELKSRLRTDVMMRQGLGERLKLQRGYALLVYKQYPLSTLKCLLREAVPIAGNSHLLYIGRFWGNWWQNKASSIHMDLKKSSTLLALNITGYIIYLGVYIYFLLFLMRLLKKREFLYFLTVFIFMLSFLVPPLFSGGGSRMRLPVEGPIVIMAFYEFFRRRRCSKEAAG